MNRSKTCDYSVLILLQEENVGYATAKKKLRKFNDLKLKLGILEKNPKHLNGVMITDYSKLKMESVFSSPLGFLVPAFLS